MWVIEFAKDRQTLTPFTRELQLTERVFDALMDAGVITYKCTGFHNGDGDAIMLGPPFTILSEELDRVVEAVIPALEEGLRSIRPH